MFGSRHEFDAMSSLREIVGGMARVRNAFIWDHQPTRFSVKCVSTYQHSLHVFEQVLVQMIHG